MAVDSPTYTQIPNQLLGNILKGNVIQVGMLADMGLAELKVFLTVCRLTFGYHQNERRASLTTLQKLTGLSRQGVLDGAAEAEERGIIERVQDGGVTLWRVLVKPVDQSAEEVVKLVDQVVKPVDRPGQASRPPSKKETRNKPKKETKERGAAEKTPPAPTLREQAQTGEMTTETELALLCGFGRQGNAGVADPSHDGERHKEYSNPFVNAYWQVTKLHPEKREQLPAIEALSVDANPDAALWEKIVRKWLRLGWNPRNIDGMLDCYERREIPSTGNGGNHAKNRRNNSGTGISGTRQRAEYSIADPSKFESASEDT